MCPGKLGAHEEGKRLSTSPKLEEEKIGGDQGGWGGEVLEKLGGKTWSGDVRKLVGGRKGPVQVWMREEVMEIGGYQKTVKKKGQQFLKRTKGLPAGQN